MSRRGRPKQPLSVIQGKGKSNHITKEEMKKRKAHEESMRGDVDNIVAPSYLTKKQKEEFYSIASELLKLDIFSNLDVDNLSRYIDSRDQYIKITRALRSMKVVENVEIAVNKKRKFANDEYAKLQRVRNTLFTECRTAASDLGLSITSRLSLVIPEKEEEEQSEFDRKFGNV